MEAIRLQGVRSYEEWLAGQHGGHNIEEHFSHIVCLDCPSPGKD